MNARSFLPRILRFAMSLALAATAVSLAHADTYNTSGNIYGDDYVFAYDFSTATAQTYNFATTSYATGGFVPVLTLFTADGMALDVSGPGTSDASLSDTLGAGSYILTLSEFPNFIANGSSIDPNAIPQSFQFYGDSTITGELCNTTGSYYDTITCTQRTSAYTLTGTSTAAVAATPEPSTWLLVLPPAAALAFYSRRRQQQHA